MNFWTELLLTFQIFILSQCLLVLVGILILNQQIKRNKLLGAKKK